MFDTTIVLTKEETTLLLESLALHVRATEIQMDAAKNNPDSFHELLRMKKIECDDLMKRLDPRRM